MGRVPGKVYRGIVVSGFERAGMVPRKEFVNRVVRTAVRHQYPESDVRKAVAEIVRRVTEGVRELSNDEEA